VFEQTNQTIRERTEPLAAALDTLTQRSTLLERRIDEARQAAAQDAEQASLALKKNIADLQVRGADMCASCALAFAFSRQ